MKTSHVDCNQKTSRKTDFPEKEGYFMQQALRLQGCKTQGYDKDSFFFLINSKKKERCIDFRGEKDERVYKKIKHDMILHSYLKSEK